MTAAGQRKACANLGNALFRACRVGRLPFPAFWPLSVRGCRERNPASLLGLQPTLSDRILNQRSSPYAALLPSTTAWASCNASIGSLRTSRQYTSSSWELEGQWDENLKDAVPQFEGHSRDVTHMDLLGRVQVPIGPDGRYLGTGSLYGTGTGKKKRSSGKSLYVHAPVSLAGQELNERLTRCHCPSDVLATLATLVSKRTRTVSILVDTANLLTALNRIVTTGRTHELPPLMHTSRELKELVLTIHGQLVFAPAGFSLPDIVGLAAAVSALGLTQPTLGLLDACARHIERFGATGLQGDQLATLVFSYADCRSKAGNVPYSVLDQPVFEAVLRELVTAGGSQVLHGLDPSMLVRLLWSFSSSGYVVPWLLEAGEAALLGDQSGGQGPLDALQLGDLAMLAWAFAVSGRPAYYFYSAIETRMAKQCGGGGPGGSGGGPGGDRQHHQSGARGAPALTLKHAAHLLWAFARVHHPSSLLAPLVIAQVERRQGIKIDPAPLWEELSGGSSRGAAWRAAHEPKPGSEVAADGQHRPVMDLSDVVIRRRSELVEDELQRLRVLEFLLDPAQRELHAQLRVRRRQLLGQREEAVMAEELA